jgi:beta-fructofuranosidase
MSESLVVDRSHSSSRHGIRRCPEEAPHTLFRHKQPKEDGEIAGRERLETLDFHIVYDSSVLEIFVNERTALTTRIYPESGTSTEVRPFVSRCQRFGSVTTASQVLSCDFWPLSPPT